MKLYIVKINGLDSPPCLATDACQAIDIALLRVGPGNRISARPAP